MQRREFHTSVGEIWLHGEGRAFDDDRPVVLVLLGAFASPESRFLSLQALLPGAAVLVGYRPGNHCPPAVSPSIGVFARGYSEVLTRAFASRQIVIVGDSVGALIALAIDASNVKGLLLVEPPLVTGRLWPLPRYLGELFAEPGEWAFLHDVLGMTANGVENRDYRGLLDRLRTPAWVVLGDLPLGKERVLPEIPSLVDEAERDLLRANPNVRLIIAADAGHNLVGRHAQAIRDLIFDLLAAVAH